MAIERRRCSISQGSTQREPIERLFAPATCSCLSVKRGFFVVGRCFRVVDAV